MQGPPREALDAARAAALQGIIDRFSAAAK
jgi:hypothetical protein